MRGADAIVAVGQFKDLLEQRRDAVTTLRSRFDLLGEQRDEAMARSRAAKEREAVTAKARMLLETYSEEEQESLRRRVEGLVSRGLSVIFGEGYGFKVEVGQSRGQASMEFKVVTPEGERAPLESHGGGVVNVVAFVLRVVIAALTPGISRTLILDEPFAQLSAEFLEPMGSFLRELVDATGLQLLIVSHEEEIAAVADKAYRIAKRGGVSVIGS